MGAVQISIKSFVAGFDEKRSGCFFDRKIERLVVKITLQEYVMKSKVDYFVSICFLAFFIVGCTTISKVFV